MIFLLLTTTTYTNIVLSLYAHLPLNIILPFISWSKTSSKSVVVKLIYVQIQTLIYEFISLKWVCFFNLCLYVFLSLTLKCEVIFLSHSYGCSSVLLKWVDSEDHVSFQSTLLYNHSCLVRPLCCSLLTITVIWNHAALQWRKMWNAAISWIRHLNLNVLCYCDDKLWCVNICVFRKHFGCDTFFQ